MKSKVPVQKGPLKMMETSKEMPFSKKVAEKKKDLNALKKGRSLKK